MEQMTSSKLIISNGVSKEMETPQLISFKKLDTLYEQFQEMTNYN